MATNYASARATRATKNSRHNLKKQFQGWHISFASSTALLLVICLIFGGIVGVLITEQITRNDCFEMVTVAELNTDIITKPSGDEDTKSDLAEPGTDFIIGDGGLTEYTDLGVKCVAFGKLNIFTAKTSRT